MTKILAAIQWLEIQAKMEGYSALGAEAIDAALACLRMRYAQEYMQQFMVIA